MRISKGNGLAVLRRWQRTICSVLLPTFAAWAIATPACFARVELAAARLPAAAMHANHSADAHVQHAAPHHEHSSPAPAAMDCPHCPPKAGDGTPPAVCAADAGTSASGTPQKSAAAENGVSFIAARFILPASNPTARLRESAAPDAARYRTHVPLNIRHCVFLI